jgi:hypothetical protein
VELFEQIRREYEFGVGTIAGVAKKLGVHRRMVREAVGSALPKRRKKTERPRWKLKAAVEFIDAILELDRKAPRKQRHTAHRVWERIQIELPDCKIDLEHYLDVLFRKPGALAGSKPLEGCRTGKPPWACATSCNEP